MRKRLITSAVLSLCISGVVQADVKLPAIFGDHMVLQRGQKVPVWGTADAGEQVTVTLGDAKATATAAADGKWSASLDSLKASDQPADFTVAGKNTITLHDVLVGDVWVASGQSNMEFQLGGGPKWGFGGAHNADEEIPKANHPTLRLFIVKKKIAFEPQTDCGGQWMVSTPETAPKFSAVGYFFGKEIQEDQKVPVGMIGTYWGGTPAEAWTSLEALKLSPETSKLADSFETRAKTMDQLKEKYAKETIPAFEAAHKKWETDGGAAYNTALTKWNADAAKAAADKTPAPPKPTYAVPEPKRPVAPDSDPHIPTVLTNGMITPIIPYAIKGAIWYQGESNAGQAVQYRTLFPEMITDWRTRWGQGDFSFIWVQLAGFDTSWKPGKAPAQNFDGWPGLRDAQTMTLKLPNTGQAVTVDIGESADIHPKDKFDVAHRLALAARHVAYGETLVYAGPSFDSMKIEGDKIRITFNNGETGLKMSPKPTTRPGVEPTPVTEVTGFAIAGADHKFIWADATIDGQTVIVSSPNVKEPQAVRYGWAPYPECNLYNGEGLPATPFRTDDWANPATQPAATKPAAK